MFTIALYFENMSATGESNNNGQVWWTMLETSYESSGQGIKGK